MSQPTQTLAALHELIQALDRRHQRVDRRNETGIAKDARLLRHQAVAQIEDLRSARSLLDRYESELADAIMNDDGAPIAGTTVDGAHPAAVSGSSRRHPS